tara:strand:+ start:736 stop:2382 length:1647 start_codon:yes stop_codon:yes gene_type:complete
MEMYLIKSAVILTILYGFYKLVLENESMHIFKRFYLLGSLPAAFLIPLVTFTSYVEAPVSSAPLLVSNYLTMPMPATEVSVNIWPFVLWGLYALGVVFFTIKFGKNLNQLISKIKNNPKFTRDSINHILLKTPVVPHTFLNYVFLNKQKFEANEIPEEVIEHEHVHAKQKHSIDILLVELLQIVFWFNPLLYFLKRSIKLNHEFLADRAVLSRGTDTATYQNLLLAFSSHAGTPTLANSINYSFIKKRFTVMKKQTSKRKIWLRSIVLLPLIAFCIYGFSERKEVIKTTEDLQESTSSYTARSISIKILEDGTYSIDGITANKSTLITEVNKLHQDITPEIRNNIMNIHVTSSSEISKEEVWFLYNSLLDYGFYRLVTPEQEVVKGKGNTPFAIEQTKQQQEKATKAEVEEYNKLAKKYNSMSKDKMRIKSEEVKRFSFLYHKMTLEQRKKAAPFPIVEGFPGPPPAPPAPDAPKVGKKPPLPFLPATPPPAPMSDPIEYIKALHKSGAVFFIGPHQYNYEEVLEMAKKTNDLNIDVSEYPKVNLLGC